MTPEQWDHVSDWHAAWLAADTAGRDRLRQQLAAEHPELVVECEALIAVEDPPPGFLETPAFVLTATRLAAAATLAPGTEVGPYRIAALLGHGGMGVVYRAEDPRLGRQVAIKMLSPIGVPDATHVDRFIQEARLTASVDHPNIVKVHDVGVFGDQPYMVIELLEGETLRARLDRGLLPVSEAERIATEIARGLAAAHGAGLVHRDLKPENVLLTRSGVTKIVDFGIAKLSEDHAERRASASTLTGILLGTAGYLAPEQIGGMQSVDARADLFALGSILFEMLTGGRAFACENTVDTLHAILHDPAPRVTERRPDVPASLEAIVARLLAKAPSDRFQSAADLGWALSQLSGGDGQSPIAVVVTPGAGTSRRIPVAAAAFAAALVMAAGGWWFGQQMRDARLVPSAVRFSWTLPAGTGLASQPAVSPDGMRIAWAGSDEDGTSWLYVRDLAAASARKIPGTDDARHPFWAPNSAAIGFFAHGRLKRVALDSGAPVTLASAPDARGGTWSPDGTIVFAPLYRDMGLMRVSDEGGEVAPATLLDTEQEDASHRWPAFLPDGRRYIYSVVSPRDGRTGVFLGSLDGAPAAPGPQLFPSESGAVFVPSDGAGDGLVVSVIDGHVALRRFDPIRAVVVGDSWTLDVGATQTSPWHPALLSASAGVLAFSPEPIPWGYYFASARRDGSDVRVSASREIGGFPRVSPDGRYVARTIVDPVKANPDIWVEDYDRGGRLPLTTASTFDVMPVWSPDGREVAFRSGTLIMPSIGFTAADGSGVTRTMPCPRVPCEATDWSPDGRFLVVNVSSAEVWALPLDPGGTPAPLFVEPFPVRDARLSPDGRWVTYVSTESGRPEVSIRSLAGTPRRYVVSTAGGDQPVWRRDGREIFFVDSRGRLHSVTVGAGDDGGLVLGPPARLDTPTFGARHWGTTYDVSPDGSRLFFPHPGTDKPAQSFDVITGWKTLAAR